MSHVAKRKLISVGKYVEFNCSNKNNCRYSFHPITKAILMFAVNRSYVKIELSSMNHIHRQSKNHLLRFSFIFHQRLCRQTDKTTNLIESHGKVMNHRYHVINF